jgi:hypothetical protein
MSRLGLEPKKEKIAPENLLNKLNTPLMYVSLFFGR